jgi:hypothetical protein
LSRLAAAASAAQLAEQSAKTAAANLSSELAEKKSENEALLSEMGNMVGAVEELQKQNERLVSALAQRDDTHQALVAVSIFDLSVFVFVSEFCFSAKSGGATNGDAVARGKESAGDAHGRTQENYRRSKGSAHAPGNRRYRFGLT